MSTRSRLLLIALLSAVLCLTVMVGGAMPASADQAGSAAEGPEIPYSDGAPIPPNVRPVMILKGSDHEIGYQWSQQLIEVFGATRMEPLQRTFTDEQLLTLKAYQWYIKESTPELIDEFIGMADGATAAGVPLSYAQVLAMFTGLVEYPGAEPAGSENDTLPPGRECSGFAAWGTATKDGKLITGTSNDNEMSFNHLIIVYPQTGNNYMLSVRSLPWPWGSISSHPGMNNKGVVYIHHGAGVAGNEEENYASPGEDPLTYILHTLRFANSAGEALEMQLGYPSGMGYYPKKGSCSGGLWADTSGDAFDIECRDPEIVRRAGENGEEGFLYASNNCLTEKITPEQRIWLAEELGWDLTYVPYGGWNGMDEDAVRRNLLMYNMLHNYQGKVDLAFVKMMWRFAGRLTVNPSPEATADFYATQGEGYDSKICALANAAVSICEPDNGDQGLFYAINGPATRQANGQCPEYAFFLPKATNTFYKVQLASGPAAVVAAARTQAMYDMEHANIELRKLTYTDDGFEVLSDLFDQAATEWYEGRDYQVLAGGTTGNASLRYYSKALRGYTQCQCLAQQVYEALVPQPDDPRDLGLKKYWGRWGDWESWLGSH